MPDEIFKRTVEVSGKLHEIKVYQKSKSVWVAVGTYMNDRLEVQGRTSTQALTAWRRAAKYRGNL